MKKFYSFSIVFLIAICVFAQNRTVAPTEYSQEIKNLMGKNTVEGKDKYEGISAAYTLALKGLENNTTYFQFDQAMRIINPAIILSCISDNTSGKTYITTPGKTDISELKKYIYEQGNRLDLPNGIEIIEYSKTFIIQKDK